MMCNKGFGWKYSWDTLKVPFQSRLEEIKKKLEITSG
jgi:hypothetical protein